MVDKPQVKLNVKRLELNHKFIRLRQSGRHQQVGEEVDQEDVFP